MGNVHSLTHRLTALSMAFLASAGLVFCALGGFSCSFIQVQAQPGRYIMSSTGEIFDAQQAFFGVQCEDSPFYDEGDQLWNLSQLFFYISLGFGGLTTLVAWALTFCIPPTGCRWRMMSILAAITAVMEVPIFLIFESDTCTFDVNRQTCKLAMGAYMNMLSVIIWVVMTIWTQCLRPPLWAEELDAWKVDSQSRSTSSNNGLDPPKSFYSTESGASEESSSYPTHSPRHNCAGYGYYNQKDQNGLSPEPSPEMRWAAADIELHGRNGADETFADSGLAPSRKETTQRDASCMERILALGGNRKSKRHSKQNQNTSTCASMPLDENNRDIIQGAAATVMESACHASSLSRMEFSVTDQSHDAICAGMSCHDDDANEHGKSSGVLPSRSRYVSMSTSPSHTMQSGQAKCCPNTDLSLSRVSQDCSRLPSAIASCMLINCDEEEEQIQFRTIPEVPEPCPSNDVERGAKRGDGQNYDHNESGDYGDETNRVDYLTNRMQTEMAAAANLRAKRNIAPVQRICIDTSYVRENDNTDELSEMTRGSGLASGVSEVLDSQRRHDNDDPLTILEDLARTY